MRKSILIIAAVAVLGALAVVAKKLSSTSPSSSGDSSTTASSPTLRLKDGTFQGSAAETPYGTVQISVVVSNGKISDVNFLQMPNGEDRSRQITSFAEPDLKANTLKAQSTKFDFVTGATSTSFGYKESLQAALDQSAKSSLYQLPEIAA